MWWYNAGIFIYSAGIRLASLWNPKARLWIRGRRHIFEKLERAIGPDDRVIWFHAASLGEFEQGRPLMERVRLEKPEYKILLTFFSPSGYEIRKDFKGADWVFYLPVDTPRAVRRFLDTVHPETAVFIKYEFWLNYLRELGRRGVRTYLISSIFRPDSIFFKPRGGIFRDGLRVFDRIFVQNAASRDLLASIGIDRVEIAGDTRFDRVAAVAASEDGIGCVADFTRGHAALVAGSTWPADETLLSSLIERHPDMRFVVAPHEMNAERIRSMQEVMGGGAVRYSEAAAGRPVPKSSRVMIVDTFGILSTLYRYGTLAYVGGGFGTGIHNILEAAAYGLPVAFGPNYRRFREACELIERGVARSVADDSEAEDWLAGIVGRPERAAKIREAALSYMDENKGAADKIIKTLFG